jgi:16S rRNA (cytidine1402-2'-O)-methyltransferase
MTMGTLFLVATPIGNLEDISLRALSTLAEVRLIAAEDTRHTSRLLKRYDIGTPMTSYHEHNKVERLPGLLESLAQGDVALVSDAGTPLLNDPGYELVQAALAAGHQVSPIPGPSAPLAALVSSGLPTDSFLYLGYLPRQRSARMRLLEEIAGLPYTLIFLETPHRLLPALRDLREGLGDRRAAVARELTKIYEEIFRGSLEEAHQHFSASAPKGEITLVIAGYNSSSSLPWSEEHLQGELARRLLQGEPASRLARALAKESGWPRSEIYEMILKGNRRSDS